ncbi:MAG: 50S ribosomal protein L31 [Candidatus Symbiodolus clandestinus]
MKKEIHPAYTEMTATCSCGNAIKTRSTRGQNIHLDVCSQCHPFYTGKQGTVNSGGRVKRFNQQFAVLSTQQ